MKPKSEFVEGPDTAAKFDALVRAVLKVPHSEIVRPYGRGSANTRVGMPRTRGRSVQPRSIGVSTHRRQGSFSTMAC